MATGETPESAAVVPLTALSETARETALARFSILAAHLEDGVPLTRVAHDHGIAPRTAQRWLSAYRKQGLVGLARKPRSDKGTRKFPEPLLLLIEGLALRRPAPSITAVHRQAEAVARDQSWPLPSYTTVRDLIGSLDPALLTLAQEGTKAYVNTFDLIYRREATQPNVIWQADHTLLDIWVLDHREQPARPWLTAVMDDFSRAVAGIALNLGAPSSLQTALALRQAIGRKTDPHWHVCGIPDVFYTDHGSDFTSRHLEQVAVDLKMQLVFSIPGMPRGRGKIERFFETVNQLLLCELPGYTPAGAPKAKATLSLSDLDTRMQSFIVNGYNRRVHSEIGQEPQARWGAEAFIPRLPDSPAQLDLLLLTVQTGRKVHPDGIHFQCMRYFDLALAAYVGESVVIRYDPRDLGEIRVYHHDAFLCRAVCAELAGETISLKDIVRARNARRRDLREEIKVREAHVAAYLPPPQPIPPEPQQPKAAAEPPESDLKRYRNE